MTRIEIVQQARGLYDLLKTHHGDKASEDALVIASAILELAYQESHATH